ncbi:GDP-mannose mannosyl hydrolase [uncultured Thiomicrorhabdus sp.]
MLLEKDFKQLIKNAPLFAIDLVIVNEQEQILVGRRKNAPAKDFWFVPGGRVYKNESQEEAFERISKAELGCVIQRHRAQLLGLFDHFYDDSFFSSDISTHYINATHAFRLTSEKLSLPLEQHNDYRWLSIQELTEDSQVHPFSKIFLPNLKAWLKQ